MPGPTSGQLPESMPAWLTGAQLRAATPGWMRPRPSGTVATMRPGSRMPGPLGQTLDLRDRTQPRPDRMRHHPDRTRVG